jgi:S-DNA-T family DNA segregation ATPase FtsK/SpoIIIE
MPGAEKLLGAGDMLYLSGEMSQPVRLQSAFITEKEVKNVVDWLHNQYKDELNTAAIDLTGGANPESNPMDAIAAAGGFDEPGEDDDALYNEARRVVIEAGKASTSYIQRKLRVGYSRAARLIDLLEERGVVGPADGAKPRDVIGAGAPQSSEPTNYDEDENQY